MCGIAGWQFRDGFRPGEGYISVLATCLASGMDTRGGDSFGISKLDSKGKVKTWKGVGRATGNLYLPSLVHTPQLMLHTRKATHGAVNVFNAHPIQHDHILGCHNGVVSNHDALNKKYDRRFELDSRHIFEHLAKGLDVGEIGVYGAISYIDLNDPTIINLCRLSSHGDLEIYGIGTEDNIRGVVYASNDGPIKVALSALREQFFPFKPVDAQWRYYLKEGRLYRDAKGALPFSKNPYRGYYTYTNSNARWWTCPKDLRLCKKCKRSYNKSKDYKSADLCSTCWGRYMELPVGTRSRAFPQTDSAPLKNTKLYCGYRCGNRATIRNGDVYLCAECALKYHTSPVDGSLAEDKKKGETSGSTSSPLVPPHPALLKPGDDGISAEGWGPKVPIITLEQWDLCPQCRAAVLKEKKWDSNKLCKDCTVRWWEMLKDLGAMPKEDRRLFNQVLPCVGCKVPTFGWLHRDAYLDDGKCIARCCYCASRCYLCGDKDPTTRYATTLGILVPYCRVCWPSRGEVVKET